MRVTLFAQKLVAGRIFGFAQRLFSKFRALPMAGSLVLQKLRAGGVAIGANSYCGWTKSCTSWKPWETTVCWYLQENHLSRASKLVQDSVHPQ